MPERQPENIMDTYIIGLVRKNKPKTVTELTKLFQQKYPIPEEQILKHILNLQNQGKITLQKQQAPATPLLSARGEKL